MKVYKAATAPQSICFQIFMLKLIANRFKSGSQGGVAYIYIDANKRGWAISNEIDWLPVSNISKLSILLGIPIDWLGLALCIASLFQSGGNVQWPSLLCSVWCWQVPHGELWPAVRVSGSHRCHIQLPDDQSHLTWPNCTLAVVPSSLWSSKMAGISWRWAKVPMGNGCAIGKLASMVLYGSGFCFWRHTSRAIWNMRVSWNAGTPKS